jgi:demethylmenaquinone methyltransferase/2-methoxy-6-polyprenyl-1,4-benzoquinol methylase
VPPAWFAAFWSAVAGALTPGGRACFIDDSIRARALEKEAPDQSTLAVWRPLRDGSERRVVKVYYPPAELAARLAELGWSASVRETDVGLLAGTAHPLG